MVIKNLKAELSEAAEDKMKSAIEQAVEKKLKKEMKVVTKKLTKHFIITSVALAGALLLANNADKIGSVLFKKKK